MRPCVSKLFVKKHFLPFIFYLQKFFIKIFFIFQNVVSESGCICGSVSCLLCEYNYDEHRHDYDAVYEGFVSSLLTLLLVNVNDFRGS